MRRQNETCVLPGYYAEFEGGRWIPWEKGWLEKAELDAAPADRGAVELAGVSVHSLLFADNTGQGEYGRWDALNHWTRPIPYDSAEWTGRHAGEDT